MQLQCKTDISAAAKPRVFDFWTTEAKRALWEDDLEKFTIDGAIQTGSKGKLKLQGKPEMGFTIVQAIAGQAYDERYELPFGTLVFSHRFLTEDGKSWISHSVKLEKAALTESDLGFVCGIFADFPMTLLRLKKLLEA
ncbi:MAG: hypothetical protein LBP52_00895 [Burkholderiaceae bacterium]|jgi:hypothetical protein|nr:hypothetical protein [Burkholderiaceae bacterium]